MTKTNILLIFTIISCMVSACKKLDYDGMELVPFAEVYFDASNVAMNNTGEGKFLEVKTSNGNPVTWRQDGQISAPEGTVTFEFYDKRNGEVLAEKSVNIVAGSPERWTLFQPEMGQPISIISPTENAEEPAAKEGFMKFKVANLATKSLPYEKIDIIVYGKDANSSVIELGKIENVGQTFQESEYQEISRGKEEGVTSFYFSFLNSKDKQEINGDGGTVFTTDVLGLPGEIIPSQLNPKNWVFTIYLLETEFPESYGICIQGTDSKWYAVNINNVLFSN